MSAFRGKADIALMIGPTRFLVDTSLRAMSALEGKADMTFCSANVAFDQNRHLATWLAPVRKR
jgi:hypothetical protein